MPQTRKPERQEPKYLTTEDLKTETPNWGNILQESKKIEPTPEKKSEISQKEGSIYYFDLLTSEGTKVATFEALPGQSKLSLNWANASFHSVMENISISCVNVFDSKTKEHVKVLDPNTNAKDFVLNAHLAYFGPQFKATTAQSYE